MATTNALMVFDEEDVQRRTLISNAFTPVIITCQADIRLLAMAVFSLLLRTRSPSHLAHFMVFINGPDRRTGDTRLQDRKQAFLEDLRECKWPRPDGVQQDMPITVCRIWSRIGHSELCDMAMPWVHTQYYVLMHDDVMILDPWWSGVCLDALAHDDVVLATPRPMLLCRTGTPESDLGGGDKGTLMRLAHLNTSFLVADKVKMARLGSRWQAHHIAVPATRTDQLIDLPYWSMMHKGLGGVDTDVSAEKMIKAVSHDVGAWVYHDMGVKGFRGVELPDDTVNHVGAASWDTAVQQRMGVHHEAYARMEQELRTHRELWAVYERYCTPLT